MAEKSMHSEYELAKLKARVKALEYENTMIMGLLQKIVMVRSNGSQPHALESAPPRSQSERGNVKSSPLTFDRGQLKELNDASDYYGDSEEDVDDADEAEYYDEGEEYDEEYDEEEKEEVVVAQLDPDVLVQAFNKAIGEKHWKE